MRQSVGGDLDRALPRRDVLGRGVVRTEPPAHQRFDVRAVGRAQAIAMRPCHRRHGLPGVADALRVVVGGCVEQRLVFGHVSFPAG